MAEEKEQVKPLAASAATVHPASPAVIYYDEEGGPGRWHATEYLNKRRAVLFCCGCCGALVVVLGFVALILALTVFRAKDPELIMESIHVRGIHQGDLAAVNVTMTVSVNVKNPNVASYKFWNSTTDFYFERKKVGVAHNPGGKVKAHRTARMNATVDVIMTDSGVNITSAALQGSVNLTSHTEISGKVNVFGIFRRELDVFLNCNMTVDLSLDSQEVNKVCGVDIR